MLKILSALGAAASLSGCVAAMMAPGLLATGGAYAGGNALEKRSYAKLGRQMASAEAIGNDLNYGSVKVSKAVRDGDTIRWTADTPIGKYACSQLAGRQHATCARR